MRVEKFSAKNDGKLSAVIAGYLSNVSMGKIKTAIKSKDVKLDGVRVKEDVLIFEGQTIEIYLPDNAFLVDVDVVYSDDNILVVNKPQGIETINDTGTSLCDVVSKNVGAQLFAVHRLDRNTSGIVVFAKNEEAKAELDIAFKDRTLEKYYLALVYGTLSKPQDKLVAYLKKDSKASLVHISDVSQNGFDKIQTNYKVVAEYDNSSLVEVELVTGKTHQIRAHFAHIGHFVVGDEKYGNSKINKNLKMKKQCLCAYKLVFHFTSGLLKYLDGKVIEFDKFKIEFVK